MFAVLIALLFCLVLPQATDAIQYLPWWDDYRSSAPSRPTLSPAELRTLDQEKAKDYAFITAKPWLQIQGKHGDPGALHQLDDVIAGRADAALINDLARKWDDAYRDEVRDALSWCECQAACSASREAQRYWDQQAENVWIGRLHYSDCVPWDVTFDEMRAWAYFWKLLPGEAYDPNREFQDVIVVSSGTATWGQIKATWR